MAVLTRGWIGRPWEEPGQRRGPQVDGGLTSLAPWIQLGPWHWGERGGEDGPLCLPMGLSAEGTSAHEALGDVLV